MKQVRERDAFSIRYTPSIGVDFASVPGFSRDGQLPQFQIQWSNFASWLNAGALVVTGATILWAVIDYFRADLARSRLDAQYLLALIATFVFGFINALVHAKDAWAVMPTGLVLSLIVFLLSLVSVWFGFLGHRGSEGR